MSLLQRSTIQLLRFPFSFFLLPVYLFAIGQVVYKDPGRALLIFVIFHGLIFPASNGYNSYMDRDEGPIGGIRNPMAPTKQLFHISIFMDALALCLGVFISGWFVAGLLVYIGASRAYSWRGIRLKRYPLLGWMVVSSCQGALTFFLVYHGSHKPPTLDVPVSAMLAASLLIGGFYPLTQIYQHEADRRDGVRTLSRVLGVRGTFLFTAALYTLAFLTLAYYFMEDAFAPKEFLVLATCMLPILVYFLSWAVAAWRDPGKADFRHTMRMNWLASICTNAGFLAILLMQ
ncbi:MAG: UbiA family prenyltransferase [Puia sp.]|nr:UbiA family prenyltransferase [Puia sp.]